MMKEGDFGSIVNYPCDKIEVVLFLLITWILSLGILPSNVFIRFRCSNCRW